jgi:hypothetical protein
MLHLHDDECVGATSSVWDKFVISLCMPNGYFHKTIK